MTPHLPPPGTPTPAALPPPDARALHLLGAAVVSEWAGLDPSVQRRLFDAAMARAPTPDAGDRELLARFLHDRQGDFLR